MRRDTLTRELRAAIRRHHIPGATAAFMRRGRVTTAAAGLLNTDTGVRATPDSLFQIGSITKVFTATLVMQLAEAGKVDLDAPVRDVLPDFTVADPAATGSVTPRQLLCHTSGIEGDYFVDSGRGEEATARLLDMGRLLPQLFPPGERMSYCNFGYAVLGRMVEVVTGSSWDAALRKQIFEPLGMDHALTRPEDTLRFRCAIGHLVDPKRPRKVAVTPTPWLAFGQKAAGSTPMMSAGDLMKFVSMHLAGGDRYREVLGVTSRRAMRRRQVRLPRHSPRGLSGWGLGWILGNWSGKPVFGHDGATSGQFAFLRVEPSSGTAFALLTNGGFAGNAAGELFEKCFAPAARARAPRLPDARETRPADVERLCGVYANIAAQLKIAADGDHLMASLASPHDADAALMPPTRIALLDPNSARFVSDNPAIDGNPVTFSGKAADGRPLYVGHGFRLYKRQD